MVGSLSSNFKFSLLNFREFKADLECSLEKLRECNPSKIGEMAQQFIEHLGDEKICYDFSLVGWNKKELFLKKWKLEYFDCSG